ncbi:ROK family protein [Streptomyces caelestis]
MRHEGGRWHRASAPCRVRFASGDALAATAEHGTTTGESPLADRLAAHGSLDARDLAEAAREGDPFSVEQLTRVGNLVGRALASLINITNPSLVLIGGGVANSGDLLLAAIREEVYRLTYSTAADNLRIALSPLSDLAGLVGAAFMVVDELLSAERLPHWIDAGSPAGLVDIVN